MTTECLTAELDPALILFCTHVFAPLCFFCRGPAVRALQAGLPKFVFVHAPGHAGFDTKRRGAEQFSRWVWRVRCNRYLFSSILSRKVWNSRRGFVWNSRRIRFEEMMECQTRRCTQSSFPQKLCTATQLCRKRVYVARNSTDSGINSSTAASRTIIFSIPLAVGAL